MAVGTVSSINYDDWQLIATTALSGTSVTFNNFSGYKTLWLVGNAIKNSSTYVIIRPNNDTSASSYATSYTAGEYYLSDNTTGAVSFKIYDCDRAIPHKVEFFTNLSTGCNPGDAYTAPNVITSIVVTTQTGATFTGGTIRLYGIAS